MSAQQASAAPRLLGSVRPLALPRILPKVTDGAFLAAVAFATYLALAIILVLQLHLIVGDAWSRVGNASYVFFARDPHLAAIGFVWNPLPSMLELPIVLLRGFWPPLVSQGFAGSIVSTVAMASAVYQLHGTLKDWGVARVVRWLLTGLFALHPMVLHYGANGDTEALFVFLLLVVIRYLARWLAGGQLQALVVAAVGLALAYWTRYEAAAVAPGVIVMVGAVAWNRSKAQPLRERVSAAAADALIAGLPFAFAFTTWALASWVIVGHPFEQFSSAYGTASQLQTGPLFTGTRFEALMVGVRAIGGLEPAAVVVGIGGVSLGLLRWDARVLAPVAVLGSVLTFALGAWVFGETGGWIRYYITVIPLGTLCAGYLVAARRSSMPDSTSRRGSSVVPRGLVAAVGCAAVLAGIIALPTAWQTMRDPLLGRGEYNKVDDLPQYAIGGEVATYLDHMRLPPGSVLVDVFLGFPIVLESTSPQQFVITPDRDFKAVLNDPQAFSAKYILVPPPTGLGALDAVNRRWPGIFETGAGIGRLVADFDVALAGSHLQWRLYAVSP